MSKKEPETVPNFATALAPTNSPNLVIGVTPKLTVILFPLVTAIVVLFESPKSPLEIFVSYVCVPVPEPIVNPELLRGK